MCKKSVCGRGHARDPTWEGYSVPQTSQLNFFSEEGHRSGVGKRRGKEKGMDFRRREGKGGGVGAPWDKVTFYRRWG